MALYMTIYGGKYIGDKITREKNIEKKSNYKIKLKIQLRLLISCKDQLFFPAICLLLFPFPNGGYHSSREWMF